MQAFLQKNITTIKNSALTSYMDGHLSSVSTYADGIPSYCFGSLSQLSSVYAPNAKYIGSYAFHTCTYLRPYNCNFDTVEVIHSGAFSGAFTTYYGSASISFPKCTRIEDYAFSSASINSLFVTRCSYIGKGAFQNCTPLKTVEAPDCSYIGSYAFFSAVVLSYATFSKCTYVGERAFENCTNLLSLDLRALSGISIDIFGSCTSINNLRLDSCSYITDNIDNPIFRDLNSLSEIYLPNINSFSSIYFNSALKTLITDISNTSYISSSRFQGLSTITTIKVSNCSPISYIGGSAFKDCHNLESIVGCLSKVLGVQTKAFENCYNLKYVMLDDCRWLQYNAFNNCSTLSNVNLPVCSNIGVAAFNNCIGLINFTAPVTSEIGRSTFIGCSNLTNVYVDSCETIESYAFSGCSNLQYLSAPKCSKIKDYAFNGCTNFAEVIFPKVFTVGLEPFSGVNVQRLYLPNAYIFEGTVIRDDPYLSYINIAETLAPSVIYNHSDNTLISNCSRVIDYIWGEKLIYHGARMFDQSCFISNLILPNAPSIGSSAFYADELNYPGTNLAGCIQTLSAPICTQVGESAFNPHYYTSGNLRSISLPLCSIIGSGAFAWHNKLMDVELPNAKTIFNEAFTTYGPASSYYNYTFPQSWVVSFEGKPFGSYVAYHEYTYDNINILVPQSMYSQYKSTYADTVYGSRIFMLAY